MEVVKLSLGSHSTQSLVVNLGIFIQDHGQVYMEKLLRICKIKRIRLDGVKKVLKVSIKLLAIGMKQENKS
jgi:hypothetical protein